MYATVDDMRAEGVTEAMCSDTRLSMLIEEASRTIDRICGWFFEPRSLRLLLDGRGNPSIEPSVPSIEIESIKIGGEEIPLGSVLIVGAPVLAHFDGPRLTLHQSCFPKGIGNVEVTGFFGYTEEDSSPLGRTPLDIKRACMLLTLKIIPKIGDSDASIEARHRWRIIEERTRDQSYRLEPHDTSVNLTGDPEIDAILQRYRRPVGMGAA